MKGKKFSSLLLSTLLLVGCGAQKTAEPEKELTMHMHFFGYCVYDEGWPIFQKASEITGVKIKGTASKAIADSSQAWAAMLASKPLPDIVHGERKYCEEFTENGGYIPLDDLIEKYAPNIRKFFEECPEAKIMGSGTDGHIYWIPGSVSGTEKAVMPSKGWFIRTDWLRKLDLGTPTTVDEMYNVLKAFKTRDPNGNGIADEIPYFNRQEGIIDLYQLFGAYHNWHEGGDGRLIFGKSEESFRTAVREVARWYKEGLIDPEVYTRGQDAREYFLPKNIGGMTHDWFSSTSKFAEIKEIPGFGWDVILPPADSGGIVKEMSSRSILHSCGWGISIDCEDPELAVKYLDFWLSDEGKMLNAYGIEGVHYTLEDGKPRFTEQVLSKEEGVPSYMRNQGSVEIGSVGSIEAELSGMNEIGRRGYEMYDSGGFVQKLFRAPKFTDEENIVINDKWETIKGYCDEMEKKWICGVTDVDACWDEYINKLYALGLEEVTEIFNTAYDRERDMLKRK